MEPRSGIRITGQLVLGVSIAVLGVLFTLGHGGDHTTAFWNVALQTAFGLAAVWSGYRLGVLIG